MMTFKYEYEDLRDKLACEIEYTLHDDSSIHEVMQNFRRFLLAVSFHPESVDEYIEAD